MSTMYFIITAFVFFGADMQKNQEFDISGLLGFLITLFVVAYLVVTNVRESLRLKKNSSVGHNKEKDDLEKIFEGFFEPQDDENDAVDIVKDHKEKDDKFETYASQPLSSLPQKTRWTQESDHFVFHSSIDDFKQKTKIEDRVLSSNLRAGDELISKELKLAFGSQESKAKKNEDTLEKLFKKHPVKVRLIIASEIMQAPVGLRSLQTRREQ